MANENIKIMNWKNGLLLSTVSYMLYLILWFILDDETAGQLPEMAIADYIIDYPVVYAVYLHLFRIFLFGL